MATVTGLFVMAALMGIYQGVNPAMGWLYATAKGLEKRSVASLVSGGIRFAWGHYLGMNAVLLPMAWLLAVTQMHPMLLMPWLGGTFIVYGLYKFFRPNHPRLLARIAPKRTSTYSFVMALTHCGSPVMMLSPLLAMVALTSHAANMSATASTSALYLSYSTKALEITAAMAGPQLVLSLGIALVVYSRLGLRALTRYWVNFDLGWALLFVVMGAMAVRM